MPLPALRADTSGRGPALVLLHAFPLTSAMFDPLVERLRPHRQVVTVDLPGLGGSPTPVEEPSMELVADAVLGSLDVLGVERFSTFGVSTGGYVAMELAARSPERVEVLGLGSTTSRLIAPDVPDERRTLAEALDEAGSVDPVRDAADGAIGPTARSERPELVDQVRGWIDAQRPDGVAWMARAIAARHDRTDVVARHPRARLVFGAEDDQTPPERAIELRDARPVGRTDLHVLPSVGHLTALEAPGAVAAAQLAPPTTPRSADR